MSANVWQPGNEVINVDAESTMLSQVFTATADQVIFNLTEFSYTPGSGSIAVYRNGQKQIKGTDYAETDTDTVTLTGISLAAGELIEIMGIIGSTGSNVALAEAAAVLAASHAANAALSETNAAASVLEAEAAVIAAEAAAAGFNPALYATAAQGTKADTAVQPADLAALQFVPVGAIIDFPAISAPTGFLKANGALLNRVTYAALWAYAQASGNLAASDGAWQAGQFSPGDGSTTFRIPDGRGEFRRGWDDGRGVDSGRAIGTAQADELKSHSHTYTLAYNQFTNVATGSPNAANMAFTPGTATGATGGAETRPRNVAYLTCIKY